MSFFVHSQSVFATVLSIVHNASADKPAGRKDTPKSWDCFL